MNTDEIHAKKNFKNIGSWTGIARNRDCVCPISVLFRVSLRPVTHEILGEASSDVIFNQNHANGVLKIVNENLAIDAERIRSGLNSDTTSQSFNEQSYRSVSHASISDIISPNTSDLNDVSVEGKSADQTTVKIISEGDNSEYMTGYYTQLVSTELHFS
jgi:hypothetical protein